MGIYIDDFWGESYGTLVDFQWSAKASQLLNYRTVKERLEASARRLWLPDKAWTEKRIAVLQSGN